MHVADNFLWQFQDEANRFIDIYHFGIEPAGFQTPLTLELLSKTIINPDCCEGKYPCMNVVNESVNELFETCSSKEKQNNLQIVKAYNNLYTCMYTKFSRDSLKCAAHFLLNVPNQQINYYFTLTFYNNVIKSHQYYTLLSMPYF